MAPLRQHPAPGNVSDSDFSSMDANDPFYIPLLANTSSHSVWPGPAGNLVPGHLTPGVSFTNHHRPPYRLDTLGVNGAVDDCNLNHSDQLVSHKDWSTRGTRHMHTHQVAGQPYMIPDFMPHFTREGTMPFFDTPDPTPPPIDLHNGWLENPSLSMGSFNICSSAGFTPWNVFNPLEPGFDILSILPSLYEGPSDTNHKCGWCVDGSPCNKDYTSSSNLKHSVSQHLGKVHNLLPAGGKSTQRCQWVGCSRKLKQESIVRHILAVHLHIKTVCKACGTSFARQDSLQRHIKNSCGASTGER